MMHWWLLHQPWRSFAAIINKCLSGKPSYDSLRLSQAQILWGMYNKKNVDYAYLLWEDFIYQIENKNTKKGNAITIPPKTKGSKKKANTDTTTKQKPPTAPKEKKSGKGKQKTTELETISEADLTEATESAMMDDDFIIQKLTTHDDDIIHEEENCMKDDSFDPTIHTPSRISSSDDEDSDNEVEGRIVEGATKFRHFKRQLYKALVDAYGTPDKILSGKEPDLPVLQVKRQPRPSGKTHTGSKTHKMKSASNCYGRGSYANYRCLFEEPAHQGVLKQVSMMNKQKEESKTTNSPPGNLTWGKKAKDQFYAFATSRESARDSLTQKERIIAGNRMEIFKEGDLHRLRIQDIEDMLLLLRAKGKRDNLIVEESIAFNAIAKGLKTKVDNEEFGADLVGAT
ncbi:hypothetical protein Tco_0652862 [Tanacetum coccineum]|uniref:No apical meristem-associated C-terminal domain-containing protein n=1 Tax=Tanacetum coccineum TaxID=301880 RepID=A0ABQ4WYR5_9ASTR